MIVLTTLGLLFALAVTAIQAERLARFDSRSFDLAIFAQGLWSLGNGHARSSIQGTSFLGVHFSPLLFALAPLARLAGSATPLLLVFMQGVALGACGPLAYLIARPAGRAAAIVLGAATLAHPGLRALALDGFHDVCLGTPLALLLALGIERAWSTRRLLLAALAVAVLADEVFPLVLPGAALWLVVEKRHRVGVLLLVLGVVSFAIVNFGVLAWARGGALHVESLYAHWRDREQLKAFLGSGAVSQTLVLLVALVGPLAFLPLAKPTRLAPGAIVFALCAASKRPAQRSIFEHYHAPVLPFVIAAGAAALLLLERRSPGRGAKTGAALVLAATLAANFTIGDAPGEQSPGPGRPEALRALVAQVPQDAKVVASIDFLHALVAREHLYGLPGAVRGTKDWSSVPYELPADLDFVLANTMDSASFPPELLEPRFATLAAAYDARWGALVAGLGVRGIEGATVLLGRGGPPLVETIAPRGTPRAISDDLHAPLLAAIEEDALVWAPPTRLPVRAGLFVLSEDGTIRPFLWRLRNATPWPDGSYVRERVSRDVAKSRSVVFIRRT